MTDRMRVTRDQYMCRDVFLLLALLMCLGDSTCAQENHDDFVRFSDRSTVLADRSLAKDIGIYGLYADEWTDHVAQEWDVPVPDRRRIVIHILADRKQFDALVAVFVSKDPDFRSIVNGRTSMMPFDDGPIYVDIDASDASVELVKGRLRHELTHAITYLVVGKQASTALPTWFREGLAVSGEHGQDRIAALAEEMCQGIGTAPTLDDMEQRFRERTGTDSSAFCFAGDFISYCIKLRGTKWIGDVLESVGKGTSFDEAFQQATGQTVDVVASNWRRDLRQRATHREWSERIIIWSSILCIIMVIWSASRIKRRFTKRTTNETSSEDDEPPPPPRRDGLATF